MDHTPQNGNSTKSAYMTNQTPTMQNVVIETPLDVLILLQIVLLDQHTSSGNRTAQQQKFPLCLKRLDETCIKQLCQHGNIFVFKEKESKMKRWTDKLNWSPSRIVMNKFLVYKQLVNQDTLKKTNTNENDQNTININETNNKKGDKLMYTGLCKKTISLKFQNDIIHVVAYYNEKVQALQYISSEKRFEIHNNQHCLQTLTEIYGPTYPIHKELQENMEKCSVGTTASFSTNGSNSSTSSVSNGDNRSRSRSNSKSKKRTSSTSSSINNIKSNKYNGNNSEENLMDSLKMPLSPPHSIMESSSATHRPSIHPTEIPHFQLSPLHYPSSAYSMLASQNSALMTNASNTHRVQKQEMSLPKPPTIQNGLQILQQQLQKPYMSGDCTTNTHFHPTVTNIQYSYNPQNTLQYATTVPPFYQNLHSSATQLSLHSPPPPSSSSLPQQQYMNSQQDPSPQQHRPLFYSQGFFSQPVPVSKSHLLNSASYQQNQLPSVQDLKLPTIQ